VCRKLPRMAHDDDDALDEGPSEEDLERFGSATQTCPECGTELYDDVELCWKCGHALTGHGNGGPAWAVWVGVAIVAAILGGLLWSALA
jgi:hypothetical protein